jgi:hypothetical protein
MIFLVLVLFSPLGGRKGFHRQGMDFVGLHPTTQRGIDTLMPLNQALAFKDAGDDGGIPMSAVARQFDVLAVNIGTDEGLKFVAGHGVEK